MTDSIELMIGRLEGKVDSILSLINNHADEITLLRNRVTELEKWRSYILGGAAVLTFLINIGFKFV